MLKTTKLKDLRERAALSQEDLARMSHVSRATIARLESGQAEYEAEVGRCVGRAAVRAVSRGEDKSLFDWFVEGLASDAKWKREERSLPQEWYTPKEAAALRCSERQVRRYKEQGLITPTPWGGRKMYHRDELVRFRLGKAK
jgi:DNA-binding XRE family transcriptional regulator